MFSFLCHGSGTIIIKASSKVRPFKAKNSKVLSNIAESLLGFAMIGKISSKFSKYSLCIKPSLALMLSTFPRIVLISPLCTI